MVKQQNQYRGLLIVLIASLAMGVSLYAKSSLDNGKRDTFKVLGTVKVGQQTLESGKYRVQHIVGENGDHFLRFQTTRGPARIFEVRCSVEPLARKVRNTEYRYDTLNGQMTELRIRGERVRHILLSGHFSR